MKHSAKLKTLIILLVSFYALNVFGQIEDTSKWISPSYLTNGYKLTIKKPIGWVSDIEHAYSANAEIVFYISRDSLDNGGSLISANIVAMSDGGPKQSLNNEVKHLLKDFDNMKQEKLTVKNDKYKCYSKSLYSENKYYCYVTYLSSGSEFNLTLYIKLEKWNGRAPTENELKTYKGIVASAIMEKVN